MATVVQSKTNSGTGSATYTIALDSAATNGNFVIQVSLADTQFHSAASTFNGSNMASDHNPQYGLGRIASFEVASGGTDGVVTLNGTSNWRGILLEVSGITGFEAGIGGNPMPATGEGVATDHSCEYASGDANRIGFMLVAGGDPVTFSGRNGSTAIQITSTVGLIYKDALGSGAGSIDFSINAAKAMEYFGATYLTAGDSIVTGAGSIQATASVTGVGASIAASAFDADAAAAAVGRGQSTNSGVFSSAAVATATGSGQSTNSGNFYSQGVSSVIGVPGAIIESGAGSITISASSIGVGASTASSAFDADATATEGGIGGVLTMTGVGLATIQSAFSSAATATAVGRGQSTNSGNFYSQGIATVTGAGASTSGSESIGYIAGTATVQGVGACVVSAAGSCAGTCEVTGTGAADVVAAGDIDISLSMVGATETSSTPTSNTGGNNRARAKKQREADEAEIDFLMELAAALVPNFDHTNHLRH